MESVLDSATDMKSDSSMMLKDTQSREEMVSLYHEKEVLHDRI